MLRKNSTEGFTNKEAISSSDSLPQYLLGFGRCMSFCRAVKLEVDSFPQFCCPSPFPFYPGAVEM